MDATIKLYDQDAYAVKFTAKVLSCRENIEKNRTTYETVLDQTHFFPEEGGQSPDKGTINGVEVLDVQIKKDVIFHTLKAPLTEGSKVEGEIDWTHRFSNMQQHSGEHIFSGLVHGKFGYDNVGFHLSDQSVTMDFNGILSDTEVREIEQKVNECIARNIEIEVTFPSKELEKQLEYRSKIEIEDQIRIVTIPGFDVCACCAPHVRRTGEIGILKVLNVQNHRGGVRINILCGFRALEDYRRKQESVAAISNALSVPQEQVTEAVSKLKNDNVVLKQEVSSAKQKAVEQKIDQIPESETHVCLFEENLEADVMRAAVNALVAKHTGYCAVFAGDDQEGYRYIIGIADGDAREMGNRLKEKFQAKGGGKPEMIQGSLQGNKADIKELFISW